MSIFIVRNGRVVKIAPPPGGQYPGEDIPATLDRMLREALDRNPVHAIPSFNRVAAPSKLMTPGITAPQSRGNQRGTKR